MKFTRRKSLWLMAGAAASAAGRQLEDEWRKIARDTDGTVGAAALGLESHTHFSLNGDVRFPLASVCKLPIAMHMLALVDEGKLARDQTIEVLPRDVVKSVSPIAERWPAETRFRLDEMLELMVAHSDNTAVETFFRLEGPAVTPRLRAWHIEGVRIDRPESQCNRDRRADLKKLLNDPRDTGTPNGTAELLARLLRGELLSASSTARMIEILKATATFPARLKGLLPPGTVVAHKTGSSGVDDGIAAATNDSGVIFLPGGRHVAVSVYLKASTKSDAGRDSIIARIARAAYDAYRLAA
jgi:beta-lactamase class A